MQNQERKSDTEEEMGEPLPVVSDEVFARMVEVSRISILSIFRF